jgi:hypothetical protein
LQAPCNYATAFRKPKTETKKLILNDKQDCIESIARILEQTSVWRRKTAAKFPSDSRNTKAAEMLDQLAISASSTTFGCIGVRSTLSRSIRPASKSAKVVYEFTGNAAAIVCGGNHLCALQPQRFLAVISQNRFEGRWLRGSEFHYPERPKDLRP